MMSESFQTIEELYKNNYYPGLNKLYQICKKAGLNLTYKQIKNFLDSQTTAQLHKVTIPRQKSITATHINEGWQLDLVDYSKISKNNNGVKWLLVVVDIFSRYAFIEPMKNKTAEETAEAFEKIINSRNKPIYIFHDMGGEFKGKFLKLVKENDIINIENRADYHRPLGIVDRFCKTFKTMISKLQTERGNTKYIDELQNIVNYYNNSSKSSINKHTPTEIFSGRFNDEIKQINLQKIERNIEINKNKIIIKVGDKVRLKTDKNNFSKGYDWNYLPDIFEVKKTNFETSLLDNGHSYYNRDLLVIPKNTPERNESITDDRRQQRIDRELRKLN